MIIAIDGPAGAGKGTVTKILAKDLNLVNIDTGATYRCVTLAALKKGLKIEDKSEIIEISKNINIDMIEDGRVLLDGEDVTDEIRSKEVSSFVSKVSLIKEVRLNMVELQRKLASRQKCSNGR